MCAFPLTGISPCYALAGEHASSLPGLNEEVFLHCLDQILNECVLKAIANTPASQLRQEKESQDVVYWLDVNYNASQEKRKSGGSISLVFRKKKGQIYKLSAIFSAGKTDGDC
ncbi:MAG: hypothetical protein HC880_12025 [Bacteroidia bacterium]|nr:hypothetical protein [Bacteroidia bacterium]